MRSTSRRSIYVPSCRVRTSGGTGACARLVIRYATRVRRQLRCVLALAAPRYSGGRQVAPRRASAGHCDCARDDGRRADAHADNISVLDARPGFVQLAPAYDVMSLTQYADHTPTLGLRINGVADANVVTLANVIAEGAGWGLASTMLRDRAAAHIAQVPPALGAAVTHAKPRQKLIDTIADNQQRLARELSIASTHFST